MKTAKQEFLASILKKGELYAGIILGKDGEPDYHLILLAPEEVWVSWETAKHFASTAGGELPTRREQSLLFANLKEELKGNYYWSGEQYASKSGYAWCHGFGNGIQFGTPKHTLIRSRAVRRVVI
jgi:hypothetical protein